MHEMISSTVITTGIKLWKSVYPGISHLKRTETELF